MIDRWDRWISFYCGPWESWLFVRSCCGLFWGMALWAWGKLLYFHCTPVWRMTCWNVHRVEQAHWNPFFTRYLEFFIEIILHVACSSSSNHCDQNLNVASSQSKKSSIHNFSILISEIQCGENFALSTFLTLGDPAGGCLWTCHCTTCYGCKVNSEPGYGITANFSSSFSDEQIEEVCLPFPHASHFLKSLTHYR